MSTAMEEMTSRWGFKPSKHLTTSRWCLHHQVQWHFNRYRQWFAHIHGEYENDQVGFVSAGDIDRDGIADMLAGWTGMKSEPTSITAQVGNGLWRYSTGPWFQITGEVLRYAWYHWGWKIDYIFGDGEQITSWMAILSQSGWLNVDVTQADYHLKTGGNISNNQDIDGDGLNDLFGWTVSSINPRICR